MTPLFFPHTYISEASAKAANAFFKKINVLQPSEAELSPKMKSIADMNLMDTICPVTGKDDMLNQAIRAFLEWGEFHQGKELSFFKSALDKIPNYDASSVSNIRAELDSFIDGKPHSKKSTAPIEELTPDKFLWWSRLFLQIAQDLDTSNNEMDEKLSNIDQMERELFSKIRGDNGPNGVVMDGKENGTISGSEDFNIAERLKAWSGLFGELVSETGIFFTDNLQVIEYLIEFGHISDNRISVGPISVSKESEGDSSWKDKLHEDLIEFLNGTDFNINEVNIEVSSSDLSEKKAMMELFLVKDMPPERFFSGFIPDNIALKQEWKTDIILNNSVICYIYYK